jgi:hypothetical protein
VQRHAHFSAFCGGVRLRQAHQPWSSISTKVAIAFWASKSVNEMLGTDTEGLSSLAL